MVKIDLKRLSWKLLHEALYLAGLPSDLVILIMQCVTSASYQLLWNREVTDAFKPIRGIRQVDPINPYLLIPCIERPSHLIADKLRNGRRIPFHFSRSDISISHLMIADDLLLFGEATKKQMRVMMDRLDEFCECARQKISKDKSRLFFSKNTPKQKQEAIRLSSLPQQTQNLGKYEAKAC